MKGSSKALLWVILVFATGSVFGAVVSFILVKNRVVERVEQSRGRMPDAERENRFLQRMLRQLNVEPEQEKELRAILERNRTRVRQLEGNRHKQLRQLRRETMSQIRSVLKPDQQRQLEDFLQRIRQRSRQQKRDKSPSESPRPRR